MDFHRPVFPPIYTVNKAIFLYLSIPISLSMYLAVYLILYISISLSSIQLLIIYLYVYLLNLCNNNLFICLSIYQPTYLSIYYFIFLSDYLSIYLANDMYLHLNSFVIVQILKLFLDGWEERKQGRQASSAFWVVRPIISALHIQPSCSTHSTIQHHHGDLPHVSSHVDFNATRFQGNLLMSLI